MQSNHTPEQCPIKTIDLAYENGKWFVGKSSEDKNLKSFSNGQEAVEFILKTRTQWIHLYMGSILLYKFNVKLAKMKGDAVGYLCFKMHIALEGGAAKMAL